MGLRVTCAAAVLAVLIDLAWSGAARADYAAGMLAAEKRDYVLAAAEFQAGAEVGDPNAQYSLGVLYDQGLGVPQNFEQALKWYRLAGEQGHPDAQANLGFAYQEGRGTEQDFAEAAHWYQRAAAQGDVQAQANLGVLYANGQGVEQDDVEAYKWLALATAGATERDLQRHLIATRDEIAGRLSQEDLMKAQLQAQDWKPGLTDKP